MARRRRRRGPSGAKRASIVDTFTPALEAATRAAPRALLDNMKIVALAGEAKAKENIPVSGVPGKPGGHARALVTHEDRSEGNKVSFAVGSGAPYSAFIELGTARGIEVGTPASPRRHWPAKDERGGGWEMMPWLRPALLAVKGMVRTVLKAAWSEMFRGFKRRPR